MWSLRGRMLALCACATLAVAANLVPNPQYTSPGTVNPPNGIFGLPNNFTFVDLSKPIVVDGLPVNWNAAANASNSSTPANVTGNSGGPFINATLPGLQNQTTSPFANVTAANSTGPRPAPLTQEASDTYWLNNLPDYGFQPGTGPDYPWFRDVTKYGAKGTRAMDSIRMASALESGEIMAIFAD
jgi:hypothetical protein